MKNKLNKLIEKSVNQYADAHDEKSSLRNSIEDEICKDLTYPTKDFKPEPIFNKISSFVNEENRFNRILFSEIYSFIYSLDDNQSSTFITNLDRLLVYSKKAIDKKYDDTRKIIVKLYDHIHAVILQDEQVRKVFSDNIERAKNDLDIKVREVKNDLDTRLNNSEKNYITILGIFASFVVTFVGGLSFSSSVLNGISTISFYRLLVVILLLGFVLMTICFSLYWFIAKIINKDDVTELRSIYKNSIIVILLLLIVCFVFWYLGVVENRNRRIGRVPISTYSETTIFK